MKSVANNSPIAYWQYLYKLSVLSDMAYLNVSANNTIYKNNLSVKVLAESTNEKPSGMQAMLLQDKQGEIFLSILGSGLKRRAG